MQWKFENLPAFSITALERSFNEENASLGIPEFYKDYKANYDGIVPARIGVCFTPEAGYDWIYAIGDISNDSQCPDGYNIISVPAQGWAIFKGNNAAEIRNYIYTDWFMSSGYEILPGYTLEYYDKNGNITEIRIPSKKRD